MQRKWTAYAPSNIALIKYMGKTDSSENRPTNTSLSYTLGHLKSWVELEVAESGSESDRWEPLKEINGRKVAAFEISEKGAARFLKHLARMKEKFAANHLSFIVRSANDFPSDCGLASSASSFAALTWASVLALTELTDGAMPSEKEISDLSRQGSGSSCRSFFSPWSIWNEKGAGPVADLGYQDLIHQVIVVNDKVKAVSSSEAHARVTSSLLFQGRPERAENRVRELTAALKNEKWRDAFEITWAEFWDMHALFETSVPSFGYMTAGTLDVLNEVRARSWMTSGDGPLVTMDAGPNVHLLHRNDKFGKNFARELAQNLKTQYKVISSPNLES